MGVALFIFIAGDPASRILLNAIRVSTIRNSLEISTNPQCACTGIVILIFALPNNRGACHIRRAGNGMVLHVLNVLRVADTGRVLCGGAWRNRYPSIAVGQGVGLAVFQCHLKDAAVQVEFVGVDFVLQLCLGVIVNIQPVHCVFQGFLNRYFLGFCLGLLLTGGSFTVLFRGRQVIAFVHYEQ